jgi:cytochrome c oxidase assembly factor CtaG/ferredoxin
MQEFVQLCLSWLWIGWTNAAAIAITAILYTRGWWHLRPLLPERYSRLGLTSFLSGLAALWIALSPPLESVSALFLSAHMVQHLLFLVVAPPLLLLGCPALPLLRGLPRSLSHDGVAPFLHSVAAKKLGAFFSRRLSCWLAFVVTLILWHVPVAFDLALRSTGWHHFEHACFLGSSLVFWGSVVRPSVGDNNDAGWILPAYLLAADIANTALSAVLTFSDRVLYPPYASVPRLFGTTALSDQVAAGLIMWVPGSLFFVVPAFVIAMRQASSRKLLVPRIRSESREVRRRVLAPRAPHSAAHGINVLEWPLVGKLLRGGGTRRAIQFVLLILAVVIVASGFLGSTRPDANLACVLPWTYWRFFAVVSLIVAGNLSCMVCPFTLPRELGRRRAGPRKSWPRVLRTKWVAVALLLLLVWAYEAFSPWELPAATAALVLAYFGASYVIGRVFEGASFCRYICPIGQFQFVGSLASPLEVKIRRPDACATCSTHDCIRGNEDVVGCEMGLHLPVKNGNMDCTFCLDCVRACPHENIGLFAAAPGRDLFREVRRSPLARLRGRSDIAALTNVFVFAAFANAAAMTNMAVVWRNGIASHFGFSSTLIVTTGFFLLSLIALPALLIAGSAAAGLALSGREQSFGETARGFSVALVPLGLAMWAAHLLFHFVMGWNSIWPSLRSLAAFVGGRTAASTDVYSPLMSADSLLRLQALLLGIGLLMTLYAGWRIARSGAQTFAAVVSLVAPWSAVCVGFYFAGVWIFLQPMATGIALLPGIRAH